MEGTLVPTDYMQPRSKPERVEIERFLVSLPSPMVKQLNTLAKSKGISRNALIRQMCETALADALVPA